MKAVISCTNNPLYSFFLPIVAYCWNKLGADVIAFTPDKCDEATFFAMGAMNFNGANRNRSYGIISNENKAATYSQLSRLMAWGIPEIAEDEVIFTSDCDMANFKVPPFDKNFDFTVWGSDLTPSTQYPVCYVSGEKSTWKRFFQVGDGGYQEALDYHLGGIECENMRGNYWCFEQELIFNTLQNANCKLIPRARPATQFATHRVDRDDSFWRERVTPDLVDAHLWRPGYEPEALSNLLELLQMMYPNENFKWVFDYAEQYKALL